MKANYILICVIFFASFIGQAEESKRTYIDQSLYSSQYQAAVNLLNSGRPAEAFPELLRFAKYGEKFAQFAVGGLMLSGDGTEQDAVEGLAWMELATEQRTSVWLSTLNSIMSQLTEEQRQLVHTRADELRALHGVDVQNMSCRMVKETGSNIRNHVCAKYPTTEGRYRVHR